MAQLRFSFRSSNHQPRQVVCSMGVVLFLSLVGLISSSPAQSKIHTVSSGTQTLAGKLHLISSYGPPGFGETPKIDSRVDYLVLYTKTLVSLPCGPNDLLTDSTVCPTTKKLQLIFDLGKNPRAQIEAKRYVGKRVCVTGTLQHASTAAESTPIVIWVKSIEPVP